MFDGRYLEWNQRRIKCIIDFYGHKFLYMKKVLDLGCGQADISGALYRLGADVTAVDARQEHLQIAGKKFSGIKTVKADLDQSWHFKGQKFDIILDLAFLCHLRNYEQHLIDVCNSTTHLILETAVCDSDDPNKCIMLEESKGIYDNSINGVACRPTAAAIERILTKCEMNFKRMDTPKLNSTPFIYDWQPENKSDTSINKRRLWFAVKKENSAQSTHIAPPAYQLVGGNTLPNNNLPLNMSPPNPNANRPLLSSLSISRPPLVSEISLSLPENIGQSIGAPLTINRSVDKKFVVVIPSYKNSKWCVQNINSALNQNYNNYRIIFTDDCSPDDTFDQVTKIVNNSGKSNKISLIKNIERLGALHNLYNMINSCHDDEIILTLDGDDWFPDENVLNKLNQVYSAYDIWMTYGQYKNSNDGNHGVAQAYPKHIIDSNGFRHHVWGASHLRTFYTWLFKKIKKEDLMQNGKFFPMTWDFAIMLPMLEMAGDHSKFLSDILYIYNMDNPINDHKVNVKLQHSLDAHIRGMPKYNKVLTSPQPRTNIGLLLIATGKYDKFIQDIVSSADKYFFNDAYDVTYYIFSDNNISIQSKRNINRISIDHKPFPHASMDRFRHFTNCADKLKNENYLYYVDVDCLFVDNIEKEILGNLVGVKHCGYVDCKNMPFENNIKSTSYVDPAKRKIYFGGGFSGGTSEKYLELAKKCAENIDIDVQNGIIPIWHDESALNKYYSENMPDIILNPSYHFPASNLEYYHNIWKHQPYKAKILLLEKNHQEIRS